MYINCVISAGLVVRVSVLLDLECYCLLAESVLSNISCQSLSQLYIVTTPLV